jgi:hypothetical protein
MAAFNVGNVLLDARAMTGVRSFSLRPENGRPAPAILPLRTSATFGTFRRGNALLHRSKIAMSPSEHFSHLRVTLR